MENSDLFVLSPRQHTFLRALAAFVIGPYLLYEGIRLKHAGLQVLGTGTILVDGYTFYLSVNKGFK